MLTKDKVDYLNIWTEDVKGKKIYYNSTGISVIFEKSYFIGYVKNCDILKTCLELCCGLYRVDKTGDVIHCNILDILYMQALYSKKEKNNELKEEFLYG